ncbi:MAG TPA: MMPL family transporter [Vicinamibacterales bacterium]|nr:MMPL family transporter [Vicinamibacterales bacterium]
MTRIQNRITASLVRGEGWIFANPEKVLFGILIMTLLFASQLPRLRVFTDFNDLLPQNHPYIQTYNRIKEEFGGANQIVMVLEVEKGDIFSNQALKVLYEATQGVDSVPGVNHNQVVSLTHRTVRQVSVSAAGDLRSQPYYDVQHPPLDAAELGELKKAVTVNPRVYGLLVSPDYRAAMIKAQLLERGINYPATFAGLQKVRAQAESAGVKVYMTGNPVLTGWVYTYLNQILMILACTLGLLASLLIVYFRRLYGIALPLLGIALSSVWGLGFMSMVGLNLEPLSMPIPFLIAARAMSHGVQLVARYYEELSVTNNGKRAARNSLDALFRPGSLAIIVDAVGIAAMVLGSAPFNWKLGISAGFWALSVIFTVHFMVPLALTVLPQPKTSKNKNEAIRNLLGTAMAMTGGQRKGAIVILSLALLSTVMGGWAYATRVQIGEAEPGSPILHRDHDYNLSTAAVNARFPGADELHIVARTDKPGGLKRPEVLAAIERFQALMLLDPELGGAKGLPSMVRNVNRLTHLNDPRWGQIPDNEGEVGGLMFAYMASSPIPGALKEFLNPDEDEALLVFYYKDHQADTINRAVAMAQQAAVEATRGVDGLTFELGGGIVGVTAAANQALHRDHTLLVPLVMGLAFLLVTLYYQSFHAGWLMVLPMLFATVMTYTYMGWAHIGISVNTVPVIMIGVGVGIDYAVYFMDRIREEMKATKDISRAAINAVSTTGYAVSFTALTLIGGVVLWIFMSDLRFQSDAAFLLSIMLIVNAIAAMLIVPAWCVVFRPRFITSEAQEQQGASGLRTESRTGALECERVS